MPVSKKRKKKGKKKNGPTPKSNKPVKSKEGARGRLLQKIKKSNPNFEVDPNRKFKHKVSELVLDYGSDFIESVSSDEEKEKTVALLIMCWNVGVLEEDKREKATRELIKKGRMSEIEDIVRDLIDRKVMLYGQYKYYIANYDVSFTKNDMYLNVASMEID